MFPKEHGAWNALVVSLAAGWLTLGHWNVTAFAATLLWLSAFILRAPLSTARQYRIADPGKSKRALVFSFFLASVSGCSAWVFWHQAPREAAWLALGAGVPLGLLLFHLAFTRPSLRFLWAELLGFAGVCLSAPILVLTDPATDPKRAFLLYLLMAGYFLSSLFYVRIRFDWLGRLRKGENRRQSSRFWDLKFLLPVGGLWTLAVYVISGAGSWLVFAPLYALGRIFAGALGGRANLPMMSLGLREMIHSFVFLLLVFAAWQ